MNCREYFKRKEIEKKDCHSPSCISRLSTVMITTAKQTKQKVFIETYGCQMDAKKDDYGQNR